MNARPYRNLPVGTRFVDFGFVEKTETTTAINLTLDFGQKDLAKVFINKGKVSDEYYNWWKEQAPERFYAELDVMKIESYKEEYKTFKAQLFDFKFATYVEPTVVNEQELHNRLIHHISSFQDRRLKELCRTFLNQTPLREKFYYSPASIQAGYCFKGGLLTHVVSMMDTMEFQLGQGKISYYEGFKPSALNLDLLKTAALFHDAGKMFAYELREGKVYRTTEGQFLSSTALSFQFLNEMKLQLDYQADKKGFEKIPFELYLELQHLVASVKEELEYGALVTPKTAEAQYFANLERIESQNSNYEQLQRENLEGGFHKLFGREVYVPASTPVEVQPAVMTQETSMNEVAQPSAHPEALTQLTQLEPIDPLLEENTIDLPGVTFEESTPEEDYELEGSGEDVEFPMVEEVDYTEVTTSTIPSTHVVMPESTVSAQVGYFQSQVSANPYVTPIEFEMELSQPTQPEILTPYMNIPVEWPETPSTPPVLSNGMPVQPVIPVQQPVNQSFTVPQPPIVGAIQSVQPIQPIQSISVAPVSEISMPITLTEVEVTQEVTASDVTVEEEVKPKKTTRSKSSTSKAKTTKKSTKSTEGEVAVKKATTRSKTTRKKETDVAE